MLADPYRNAVLAELTADRLLDLNDNYDPDDLHHKPGPQPAEWRRGVSDTVRGLREAKGVSEALAALSPLGRALAFYLTPRRYFLRYNLQDLQRGEFLYDLLADDASKALMVKLMAYRILGHRKVKLPRNTPKYWEDVSSINNHNTDAALWEIPIMGFSLAVKDMRPLGYDMAVYAGDDGLACILLQKQYEYHHGDIHCKAEAGDVVVDAGVCWGEASLYFAHEIGPAGKVVSFEFIPSNLDITRQNLTMNPHLKDRIDLVERPLWSTTGLKLGYVDWGPGSRVVDDPIHWHSCDGMTETLTIDDALAARDDDRVDFIKMDIEGAELDALKGAEASIRKHRPKLAISLYHKPDDFETIPRFLAGLDLGYRFYLEHHTIYNNETVLFAVPQDR